MGIVIARASGLAEKPAFAAKASARLQKILFSWFVSQSKQRRQWHRFRTSATGRGIPYRVWLRHSAYLEGIKRETAGY